MVQLKQLRSDHGIHYLEGRPKNYWKLDSGDYTIEELREFLESVNISCQRATTRHRLRVLYIRNQRGLISYERLTTQELTYLLQQRGLPMLPINDKTAARHLTYQLEAADDSDVFAGFSSLPPELRTRIYNFHLDSFADSSENSDQWTYALDESCLCTNWQPPITLASRMTRKEALPLFYDRCTFTFYIRRWALPNESKPFDLLESCFTHGTKAFILSTSDENFSRIRYFKICMVADGYPNEMLETIIFDLSADNSSDTVVRCESFERWLQSSEQAQRERFREVLELAKSVAAREETKKLCKDDIISLHNAICKAF